MKDLKSERRITVDDMGIGLLMKIEAIQHVVGIAVAVGNGSQAEMVFNQFERGGKIVMDI